MKRKLKCMLVIIIALIVLAFPLQYIFKVSSDSDKTGPLRIITVDVPVATPNELYYVNYEVCVDDFHVGLEILEETLPTTIYNPSAIWTGNYVYIFGGCSDVGYISILDRIIRFDPDTEAATILNVSLPTARYGTSVVWDGQHVYIFGGRNSTNNFIDEIVRFDPLTESVTVLKAALPSARCWTSAIWDGHYAYIFGGYNGTVIGEIVMFNPSNEAIKVLNSSLPRPIWGASAVWDGQFGYILGGYTGHSHTNEILQFDPVTENVTILPSLLPTFPLLNSAVWDGEYIYIFFGEHYGATNDILRFDPITGSTSNFTPLNLSKRRGTSAVFDGENIYVFGGRTDSYTMLDEIIRFAPRKFDFPTWNLVTNATWLKINNSNGNLHGEPLKTDIGWYWVNLSVKDDRGGFDFHNFTLSVKPRVYACSAAREGSKIPYKSNRLPSPRTYTASIWDGKHIYVFGGICYCDKECVFRQHLDDIVCYDPITKTISTLNVTLPSPRAYLSVIWTGQYAYIFGGNILRFDPSTLEVTAINITLPASFSSAVWDGHYAYLFGGMNGSGVVDDIIRFDPTNDTLEILELTLPSPRAWTSAVWTGDRAYIFGGCVDMPSDVILDEILVFDPVNKTVMMLNSTLPTPLFESSAIWDGTYAYIFGGSISSNLLGEQNNIIRFDPVTGTVILLNEKLPTVRTGTSAVWDGQIAYIIGGSYVRISGSDKDWDGLAIEYVALNDIILFNASNETVTYNPPELRPWEEIPDSIERDNMSPSEEKESLYRYIVYVLVITTFASILIGLIYNLKNRRK